MRRPANAFVLGVVAAAVAAAAAMAQTGNTCDGTFTVAGSTAKLKFASAAVDSLFSSGAKEHVRVVLSDVQVPPETAADDFALQKLMRDGRLHAVVLIISPDKQVVSTQLYDSAFKMDSVSSAGTNNRFDATSFGRNRVAGKAYTRAPDDFRSVRYEYSATFDATVHRK